MLLPVPCVYHTSLCCDGYRDTYTVLGVLHFSILDALGTRLNPTPHPPAGLGVRGKSGLLFPPIFALGVLRALYFFVSLSPHVWLCFVESWP